MNLGGGFVKGLIKAGGDVFVKGWQTVKGSKAQQDQQASDLSEAGLAQFGQEFQYSKDGWFDSLVNGLNRLPRPMFAFMVAGYFLWVVSESETTADFTTTMTETPTWMTYLMASVVLFFFGARPLEKHFTRRFRKADREANANRANTGDTGAVAPEPTTHAPTGAQTPNKPRKPALDPEIEAWNAKVSEDFFARQARDR